MEQTNEILMHLCEVEGQGVAAEQLRVWGETWSDRDGGYSEEEEQSQGGHQFIGSICPQMRILRRPELMCRCQIQHRSTVGTSAGSFLHIIRVTFHQYPEVARLENDFV